MPARLKPRKEKKRKEKSYKLSDGGGLYLLVEPNGSRYWRMKYRVAGKEKRLSFGVYPTVSLANARQKREDAKNLSYSPGPCRDFLYLFPGWPENA